MKKYIPAVVFAFALVVIYNVVEARTEKVVLPTAAEYVASENEAYAAFDIMLAALEQVGMSELLGEKGPYTVFIPTDRAFIRHFELDDSNEGADESEATILAMLPGLDAGEVKNLLEYHVISGNRGSKTVSGAKQFTMLNGEKLSNETLMLAGIAASGISVSNGYVNIIDGVLVP